MEAQNTQQNGNNQNCANCEEQSKCEAHSEGLEGRVGGFPKFSFAFHNDKNKKESNKGPILSILFQSSKNVKTAETKTGFVKEIEKPADCNQDIEVKENTAKACGVKRSANTQEESKDGIPEKRQKTEEGDCKEVKKQVEQNLK